MIPMRGAMRDRQLNQNDEDMMFAETSLDLSAAQAEAVRSAVNISRDHQCKTTKDLIKLMKQAGYTTEDAKEAVDYWVNHVGNAIRW